MMTLGTFMQQRTAQHQRAEWHCHKECLTFNSLIVLPLVSQKMFTVQFHLSENVLNGFIGCPYCRKKNIKNYENAFHHLNCDCKSICEEDCECNICQMTCAFLIKDDGINIYVNKRCVKDYFFPSIKEYWGINEPCFLLTLKDDVSGELYIMNDSPASAS